MASISGLGSGLDTASIVDQLMQLEALPQNRLKNQQTAEKARLTALRALNTDTSALRDKAQALALTSTWNTVQGTVTGSGAAGVSVKVGAAAAVNAFTVTVDRLATRHQLGFANSVAMDAVIAGPSVKLTTHDGTEYVLPTGGGTLTEVVDAINASTADTGVSAVAVKSADGTYRMMAQSSATGASSSFTLTKLTGGALLGGATISAGTDAQVSLGAGVTATSSSNTFTGIVPGVDLTLDPTAAVGSSATVTLAQSSSTVSTSVKDLVTQLNALLKSIDDKTARQTATSAAGVMAGEPAARDLRQALLQTVFGPSGSMADVGIQTDRYGKLVFDEKKFADAYAKDPAAVAAKFTSGSTTATDGFAARVKAAAANACDRTTGTITSAIASRDASVSRFTKSIEAWDDRLELRRTTLARTYTALETALSGMQSQGNWLAGQLAGLPSYS